MKIKVPFNKENIKILKNIKEDNEVSFKVLMEEKIIEVIFTELKVLKDHYISIDEGFIDLLIESANNSKAKSKIYDNNDTYIIKEVTEKFVSLRLSLENTLALENLLKEYPDKTQTALLNDLIEKGRSNLGKES